jgi:hypothetical protein
VIGGNRIQYVGQIRSTGAPHGHRRCFFVRTAPCVTRPAIGTAKTASQRKRNIVQRNKINGKCGKTGRPANRAIK